MTTATSPFYGSIAYNDKSAAYALALYEWYAYGVGDRPIPSEYDVESHNGQSIRLMVERRVRAIKGR